MLTRRMKCPPLVRTTKLLLFVIVWLSTGKLQATLEFPSLLSLRLMGYKSLRERRPIQVDRRVANTNQTLRPAEVAYHDSKRQKRESRYQRLVHFTSLNFTASRIFAGEARDSWKMPKRQSVRTPVTPAPLPLLSSHKERYTKQFLERWLFGI